MCYNIFNKKREKKMTKTLEQIIKNEFGGQTILQWTQAIVVYITTRDVGDYEDELRQTFNDLVTRSAELATFIGTSVEAEAIAMNIFNTLLCHLDNCVNSKDDIAFKTAHLKVARDVCRDARANASYEDFVAASQQIVSDFQSCARTMGGIQRVIPCGTGYGIVTSQLSPADAVSAAIAACVYSAPQDNKVIDAGALVDLGRKFTTKLNKDLPGLEEADFFRIVDTLIDRCFDVYGAEQTQSLINRIVDDFIKALTPTEVTQHNEYVTEVFPNAPTDVLKITNIVGQRFKHGLSLCYRQARQLSLSWIKVLHYYHFAAGFSFKIGLVDVSCLLNDGYYLGKHSLVSHVSSSYIIMGDYDATGAAQKASGEFAIPYLWEKKHVKSGVTDIRVITSGVTDIRVITIDNILCDPLFEDTGHYTLKPISQRISGAPQRVPYYYINAITSTNQACEKDGDLFVVCLKSGSNTQAAVWGQPLSSAEAEKVLPYLDFLPGQEQDTKQDTILCKTVTNPVGSIANALLATQTPYLIVRLQEQWAA
jgi:hypothetical protein